MNDIQVLAVLAMVSMSIPAALAFMFWKERNDAIEQRDNWELNFLDMQKDMKFWKHLATGDDVGLDIDDYLDDWQGYRIEEAELHFGPREKWGSSNNTYSADDQVIWGSDYA